MDIDDDISSYLAHYDEKLLAVMASKLFRARIGQPADELIERILETQKNPPVVDRVIKALPATSLSLVALLGRSRQTRWKIEDLLTLTVALGSTDGFPVISALLERGLLVAVLDADLPAEIDSFPKWFATVGPTATVHLPAAIAVRAAALPLRLREQVAPHTAGTRTVVHADGLDWPLRLAAVRQQVRLAPVKLTQTGALYKRDITRFTGDPVLQAPFEHGPAPVDAGLLALTWARAAGLVKLNGELAITAWPDAWSRNLSEVIGDLFAALFAISEWDPLAGSVIGEPTATITVGLLLAVQLADEPTQFHSAASLALWLWEHHPHWSGLLPKGEAGNNGRAWIEAYIQATLIPLGVVEIITAATGPAYRLTELGRHLLANGPAPAAPTPFPKTLLAQPNGEILVYRQGLTPTLLAKLTGFAGWKQIGAACTLELTTEGVTRGLEDGQTLADILQLLDRYGMKPTPGNVQDLLRRWADKRERLVVYPSATLVEFLTSTELDEAIARGIVSVRLTDRIGVTADGTPPDFQHLRLLGNRDYEATPAICVLSEDDGVTLRVDAAAADLLLDAEIARFAEPLPGTNGDARRYRMTPATLRTAAEQGMSLPDLESWFVARSGEGLPAAAKLFLLAPGRGTLNATKMLVLETPSAEVADGILQWPMTSAFITQRLGPTAIAVDVQHLEALRERLAAIDIRIEPERG